MVASGSAIFSVKSGTGFKKHLVYESPMKSTLPALLVNISTTVVTIILCLLACEFILAGFAPHFLVNTDVLGKINTGAGAKTQIFHAHGETYVDFVPGQRGWIKHRLSDIWEYEINSLSLRNRELSDKKNETFRILILGDSQTYGYATQNKTFPAILEKKLQETVSKNIEVLNAGVHGYGPFECLWKLERVIEDVKPDLVVVTVFAGNAVGCGSQGNDLDNLASRLHTSFVPTDKPISSESFIKKMWKKTTDIREGVKSHSHIYAYLSSAKHKLLKQTLDEYYVNYQNEDHPEFHEMVLKLKEKLLFISAFSKQYTGRDAVILYLPTIQDLKYNVKYVSTELENLDVPVISTQDSLREAMGGDPSKLHLKFDLHYNDFANTIIAEELYSYLVKEDYIRL